MRFYVNRKDVKRGEIGDPNTCVVARALRRKLKRKVEVNHTEAAVYKQGTYRTSYRLVFSERTSKAIAEFDKTGKFTPGHYSARKVKVD